MEDMLIIYANAALKQTSPSIWDTAGWNWYLMMAKSEAFSEEEKLKIWKRMIDAMHRNWTWKYRQYAKANGIHANFSEEEAGQRENATFASDMQVWDSVKLKRIERIDGILKFFTETNETFELDVKDIYSQAEFKRAFTVGTMTVLPPINQTSYQKFIESLQIVRIENIGATLLEKIEEVFETQSTRLKDTEIENENEALEAVESRSFAIFQGNIYFRITALLSEIQRGNMGIKQSSIFTMLRDIGAENIKHRKFNFWKYDLSSKN